MASWILDNIGSGSGLLPDGTKPLSEPTMTYSQLDSQEQTSVKCVSKYNSFHSGKKQLKMQNDNHIV